MSDQPSGAWLRRFFTTLFRLAPEGMLREAYSDQFPEAMARDMPTLSGEDAAEMAVKYMEADDEAKADIVAFFESQGPRRVSHLRAKDKDGIPLPEECGEWPEEGE